MKELICAIVSNDDNIAIFVIVMVLSIFFGYNLIKSLIHSIKEQNRLK